MPLKLIATDPNFPARFDEFVNARREPPSDVAGVVAAVIADIRARGDQALLDLTRKFDRLDVPSVAALRVSAAEIDAASAEVPQVTRDALDLAARRIDAYHRRQVPQDQRWSDEAGVSLGWRWTPLSAVGLYVPGGTAAYPSSVLMNAIPAKVAGVDRLAMVVPAPDGKLNPLVLAAAKRAGVDEVWRVGGAQAVAALAFGTETIKPVDKIVGPGNAYVAEAKRQVFGTVGINSIAGPSEILVVADAANNPAWIAADLLSQAEHDALSQSVLITDDASFADNVLKVVDALLQRLPRGETAAASWRDHGAVILVEDLLRDAPALVDAIAPEHVELAVADPEAMLGRIRHAGAIFLGSHTPEAIGDYVAGSNHVLPTSRAARYASGLGVLDFLKRSSIVGCTPASTAAIGPAAVALAIAEGLDAHAISVALRLDAASQEAVSEQGDGGAEESEAAAAGTERIVAITLDEKTVVRRAPEIEHERAVAIFDLIEGNRFVPVGEFTGPYALHLSVSDNRLVMDLAGESGDPLTRIVLPLSPFRGIIKDYFQICESYFQAIRSAPASRIEAIDMGRRGLHNEGSELLRQRLKDKVEVNSNTARRLFTLVCVLHIRG